MGSLVTDFLINPVLRQARRFSRSSNTSSDVVDPITNQITSPTQQDDTSLAGTSERVGHLSVSTVDVAINHHESISGAVITSSPIEDDGGLDGELRAIQSGRSPSAPTTSSNAIPRRMLSLTSNSGRIDDDISDNPSFGTPGRFRASSNTSNRSDINYGSRHSMHATMSSTDGNSRRSTRDHSHGGSGSPHITSSLPADDGMGYLRHEIRKIQSSDALPAEKARLMHLLLTRDYTESRAPLGSRDAEHADLTEATISQERPTTPSSLASLLWQMNGISGPAMGDDHHTYHLSANDLKPTYAPEDPPEVDDEGDVIVKEIEPIPQLGCKHYKRNVKLQCSACARWYTCRLCHDETENHILNRKETKNMLCMICSCAQKAGEFCVGCGERTAWYYCDVCKLWDNDSNHSIYHCVDCGICRKGRGLGKDFFHCKTCGTCMSMSVEKSHKCIERVSDCDCPICGEYMFTSPAPVVFMLCGHGIHRGCYDEHMKSSYKCPICSRSTVNMESQFRALDRAIDSQPMPPQFQDTKAMVSCNDCYAKSAVAYHWLGLKCAICDSYNTVQLSIISDPAVVPSTDTTEPQAAGAVAVHNGEMPANVNIRPTPGPVRIRRHSSHMHVPSGASGSGRFSPYAAAQRIGRSVSPIPTLSSLFENFEDSSEPETDVSVVGDDLDFWGREEPRSVTSTEQIPAEEMDEEEDDSDDDSVTGDCLDDEMDDENDPFELFGHR